MKLVPRILSGPAALVLGRRPTRPADSVQGPPPPAARQVPAEPAPAPAQPRPSPDRDGAIWVRDGRVHVRRPRGAGRWPSVEAPDACEQAPLEVLLNGRPLVGRRVVREVDRIDVRAREEVRPGGVNVEVDPDGLRAWVSVRAPVRRDVRLPDAPPALHLKLGAAVAETPLPLAVGEADVLAAVESAGVRLPLREGSVARALARPGERVLVAEGVAPGRGQPAVVWTCLDRREHAWPPAPAAAAGDPEADRPDVEMGETLVEVRPGRPARPGVTVTGRRLAGDGAPAPRLVAGPGVLLSEDGLTAIAERSGRASIHLGSDRIAAAVYPERRILGDVSAQALRAQGDLYVGGSVGPGGRIAATGRVEVAGDVARAHLEAVGGIAVRGGVASSLLLAGGPALTYAELLPDCAAFVEEAAGLERAVEDGPGAPAARVVGDDGWTPRLRRLGHRLGSALSAPDLAGDPQVALFGRALLEAMARRRVSPLDVASGELAELRGRAEAALDRMRAALSLPAHCRVRHLDHTRVEATGDVVVEGSGCYHAHVKAGGAVRVLGRFRCGSVVCAGEADFEEVGSPGEVATLVQLAAGGCFRARLVHPGTVVRIGLHTRCFEAPSRHVVLGPELPAGTFSVRRPPFEDAPDHRLTGAAV